MPVNATCIESPSLIERVRADHVRRIRRRTRAAYRWAFDARIEPVFDRYLELGIAPATLTLGFAPATDAPLFLEQYLDQPVQQVLAQRTRRPVDRSRIIELGHLVGDAGRNLRHLIPALACWTDQRAAHFVVIVLTARIAERLTELGVELLHLAEARAERVAEPERWGNYYLHQPAVYAVDLVQRRREQRQ